MSQKKVLIFETSNTLKTAFKLALEGSEWKIEIISDPDLIPVHMEAFEPDVVILEKKNSSSETLNFIKNSDVKMILSTASPENKHSEISRPFSTKELFEILSENSHPDTENEEDIPEAEEVFEENDSFDTADEPLILDSDRETTSEEENGFTQEDEPSINPLDEISEKETFAAADEIKETAVNDVEQIETTEDTENSLSEHLSKSLMDDLDEDSSEDEAYVAEIIEDDKKTEEPEKDPEFADMISETSASQDSKNFEEKSDTQIPEFDEDELVSIEPEKSFSDSDGVDPLENEKINSIIKKELEKVMRDVFWEEAPKIIEDVIEKKLNKMYGEKELEG